MKKKWIAAISSVVLGCSTVMMPFASSFTVNAADTRSGFVTTNGTQFMLDGSTFYYAGTNNYYLNFKPKESVDAVLEDAAEMGLKVVRTWGNLDAGVKTDKVSDKGYTVFTDNVDGSGEKEGVYYQYFDADLGRPVVNEGEDGLQKLDYALYKAEQEGIKLLITFTNNWEAFGGMGQYVQWAKLAGENVSGHDDFYTNETIKGWYKDYIKTLLNHENVYTGVKYKDDPTIFSWELANEPRCESDAGCENNTVVKWATEMSTYVKSIDDNHMLAVGDEGFYNYGYNDFPEGDHKYVYHGSSGMDYLQLTSIPDIDFGTLHVYCDQWGLTKEQGEFWFKKHGEDTAAMNKPLIAEEFGWKDQGERADVYTDWFNIFEGNTYEGVEFAGTNYWMLASMDGGSLYQDYDGYTVYFRDYPKTNDARDVIMAHAERMNARNAQNSVSPKKADFDIVNPKDVTLQATIKLGSISGLQLDDTALTADTDYSISGTTVTISKNALQSLELGNHKVTLLTTEGAQPTALIRVYDSTAEEQSRSVIDDFESYADSKAVAAAYQQNSSGDSLTLSLDTEHVKNGKAALKYDYSVTDGGAGYCGATKNLGSADWTGFDGIRFWILSDGSNRETTFQFVDGAGAYWESVQKVTAEEGWTEVKIPFSDFYVQQWGTAAETPTLSGVKEFSLYTGQNGNPGTGVWYFDDIGLYHDGTVTVPDAEATETEATFDPQDPTDIIFTIITNGHVLTGITENYMFTRLYLSGAQLESLLGGTPEWNTVYGLTGCTTEAEYNALRTKLLDCNYVSSVSFTEDTTSMFGSLIGSLNYVVVLIIVCAAALAAVVLYNLISVNLAERKKELATIKVLGFYDKEVYRYIFREIELLSLIGSGVGLLLGVPLHRFIVLTVEMDQLMFIRTIAPRSYLLAVALTMLFTFVVCFAMRRHVRHISMVESMKAPE